MLSWQKVPSDIYSRVLILTRNCIHEAVADCVHKSVAHQVLRLFILIYSLFVLIYAVQNRNVLFISNIGCFSTTPRSQAHLCGSIINYYTFIKGILKQTIRPGLLNNIGIRISQKTVIWF